MEKSTIYNSDKVKITSNGVDISTVKGMDEQITFADNGQVVMAVLHGYDVSSSTFKDVKVNNHGDLIVASESYNTSDVRVNPATEEKQDSIRDLTQGLYELIARLDFLPSIRGTLADIRVTPTGTVTVAGSLTTLSNQTQTGGYFTNNQIQAQMNLTAVQSNINNITI